MEINHKVKRYFSGVSTFVRPSTGGFGMGLPTGFDAHARQSSSHFLMASRRRWQPSHSGRIDTGQLPLGCRIAQ